MPQVVNLDAVVVDYVEVRKTVDGKLHEWRLRDDVPSEEMFRLFGLVRDGMLEAPEEDVLAVFHAQDRVATDALLAIFRHSYPETTEEDLRHWFDYDQRNGLVQLFFSRHWSRSRSLIADSANGSPPTPKTGTRTRTTRTRGSGTRRAGSRAR